MDKVKLIYEKILDFIQLFKVKYEYENRGLLKKMKIDSRLNLEIPDNKWCKLFLYKSCFNHCAKFVLLRYIEDTNLINMKMNREGIKKWENLVKNISQDFNLLYDIAIRDLQEDENDKIRGVFKNSDYDIFQIEEDLGKILADDFSNIDFSNFKKADLIMLFKFIYSLEEREDLELEKFYKDAPALSYILRLEEMEKIF